MDRKLCVGNGFIKFDPLELRECYSNQIEAGMEGLRKLCRAEKPIALRMKWPLFRRAVDICYANDYGGSSFSVKLGKPVGEIRDLNGDEGSSAGDEGSSAVKVKVELYLLMRKVRRPKEARLLEEACKVGKEIALPKQMVEEHRDLLKLYGYRRTGRELTLSNGYNFEPEYVYVQGVGKPTDYASLKEACKRGMEVLIPQPLAEEQRELLQSYDYFQASSSAFDRLFIIRDEIAYKDASGVGGNGPFRISAHKSGCVLVEHLKEKEQFDSQNVGFLLFAPCPPVHEVFPSLSEMIQMLLTSFQIQIRKGIISRRTNIDRKFTEALRDQMRCFQIALAIGDYTAQTFFHSNILVILQDNVELDQYDPEVVGAGLAFFWHDIGNEDEMAAWAAYYIGLRSRKKMNCAISFLTRSYEHAIRDELKFLASGALVDVLHGQNMLDETLKWSEKHVKAARDLKNPEYICSALLDVCDVYCFLGRWEEARQAVDQIKKIAHGHPQEKRYEVRSLLLQARVASQFSDKNKCEQLRKDAIKLIGEEALIVLGEEAALQEFFSNYMRLESNNASILLTRMLEKVVQESQETDRDRKSEILRTTDWDREFEKLQISNKDSDKCTALMHMGELISATGIDEESIKAIDILFSEAAALLPDSSESHFGCLFHHGRVLFIARQYDRGIQMLEKALASFIEFEKLLGSYSDAKIAYLDNLKCVFDLLQIYLVRYQRDFMRALVWSERSRARDLIYGINDRLKVEKYKDRMSAVDHSFDEAKAEISSICTSIGHDTVFFVFSATIGSGGQQIIRYIVHHNSGGVFIDATCTDFTSIKTVIQTFLSDLNLQGSKVLFELLIGSEWERNLEEGSNIRKIVIVPEELSLVPFAALYDEKTQQYLIEKYAIAITPSLRMFKQGLDRWHNLQKQEIRQALVVGNPTSNLDEAEKEADIVEESLKGRGYEPVVLKRGEATTTAVLNALPSVSWIHIASHAAVNDKYPKVTSPPLVTSHLMDIWALKKQSGGVFSLAAEVSLMAHAWHAFTIPNCAGGTPLASIWQSY